MDWSNISEDNFWAVVGVIFPVIISLYIWSKSYRPIVTAILETRAGGNSGIFFDLQISNSGSCPAKNIRLLPNVSGLKKSFGKEAREQSARNSILACFKKDFIIAMLPNNKSRSFSFGYTKENNTGFWKYGAKFPITIEYESWLRSYEETQEIVILDSDGSAGYGYGKVSQKKETVTLNGDEIPQKIQELIPSATVTYNKYPPSPPA